ncbi:ABC transporter ATP-binding protein [Ensifer sp. YR511]|uniref:ABC transporter ATP-binding protein n=1 Tax=Ensifer sp. YR511 TaxID=1855294 RepID=UPI000880AF29|nr:ABC transporter ATP-binding protein [Ensifer sp. YR511]SDN70863.1 putative spermidine/putrescine transport system ATP-binding protein [Ensifer sp. YR511]
MLASVANPLITFSGIDKTYDGETFVTRNLNFAIEEGEFLSLLGPSGSGKTTTLMMLAGFEAPSGGAILLGGSRLNETPPHRRNIGMVFQNYALFPNMTVAQNIAFPLAVRKVGKSEQRSRVEAALSIIELAHLADRRPAQLSGGQQQRVALARALVFEPKLVLMDEPLGALDKNLREAMQYEIKRIHKRLGVTIVYVTHDQSEALTMSDRVAVFHHGRIQQMAAPKLIYEDPANAFVASFIGENNGLEGQVVDLSDDYASLTLTPDVTIRGRAGAGLSIGKTAFLALRPENVSFDADSGEGSNRLTGIVKEAIYCGDHWRLHLTVAGRDGFIMKVPNRAGMTLPVPGQPAAISWRQDDCKVVASESA